MRIFMTSVSWHQFRIQMTWWKPEIQKLFWEQTVPTTNDPYPNGDKTILRQFLTESLCSSCSRSSVINLTKLQFSPLMLSVALKRNKPLILQSLLLSEARRNLQLWIHSVVSIQTAYLWPKPVLGNPLRSWWKPLTDSLSSLLSLLFQNNRKLYCLCVT